MIIRNEKIEDYKRVEEITRLAFWNLHTPGCNEHYLIHKLRTHKDFVPELSFVISENDVIVGCIMYTKSTLINETTKEKKEILTFGPLSVLPEYQRKGYGKKLIEFSINKAKEMNYSYIVIFGSPSNYVSSGFKSCIKYNIYVSNKKYPTAMLVKKIGDYNLNNGEWKFVESDVFNINESQASEYYKQFCPLDRSENEKQEEFFILKNSRIIK